MGGPESLGIVLAIFGIFIVIISSIVQFYNLNHGSSNQLTIDKEVNTNIMCALTGLSFFAVGFILWIMFSNMINKYLALFLLSFSSYIISNIAILFSLYQVTVVKT